MTSPSTIPQPANTLDEFTAVWQIESLRRERRFAEAETAIADAAKEFPARPEVLMQRALLHYDLAQFNEAAEAFDEVLKIDPAHELAWDGRLTTLRLANRVEEAESEIKGALQKLPNSVHVLAQRGLLHYDQKQYGKAVEALDRALAIDPDNQFAWEWKLVSLRLDKKFEDAEREMAKALEKFPGNVTILNESGLLHYDQKRYGDAVEAFERALSIDPDNEFAWEWKLVSLRFNKQFEDAEKEMAKALERFPRKVTILNESGLVHYDLKRYGEAVEAFERALSIDPDNEFAWEWKLVSLRSGKRFEEAEKEMAKALEKFPNSFKILFQRGVLHHDQKRYGEAVKALSDSLEIDPDNEATWEWKLVSLRLDKQFEAAGKEMAKALEKFPGNVKILNESGLLHYDQKRYDKAAQAFERALSIDPDNEFAWEWKLVSLRLDEKFEDAEKEMAKALEKFPKNFKMLFQRGVLHHDQKRYGEAVKALTEALEIDPDNESMCERKLVSLRLDKQFEAAGKEMAKALEKFPGNVTILNESGLLHYDQKQYGKAVEAFERALSIEPDNEFAWEWKLVSLRLDKKFEDAEREMAKALEKFPNNAKILLQRGQLHYEQKRYGDAVEAFERALSIDPANEFGWEWKIASLRFNKQFEVAENETAKALEKFPANAKIVNESALLYYDQKQYSKAVEAFERALSIDPDNEFAWEWKIVSLRFDKQFEVAENEMAKALEKFPNNAQFLNQRGLLHYDQAQYSQAAEVLKNAQLLDPNNEFSTRFRLISLRLAARASQSPKYREIEKELRAARERFPESLDIAIEYGWFLFDRRDYDKAVTVFDGLIAKFPDDQRPLSGKIESLRSEQRYEEAIPITKRGLAKWPDSTDLLRAKAALYFDQYKYEKAAKLFRELLAGDNADPFDARLLFSSLRSLHQEGKSQNLDEAEAELKNALKRFPKNPELLVEAAMLCAAQDRGDDAEDYFTEAQEIDCSNLGPWLAYADFLNTDKRGDKALEVLLKLKEDFADHVDVIEQLGWLYIDRGDLTNAERVFKEIREKLPLNAINGLGGVSFNRRDYTEAASHFEHALKLSPKHPVFNTNLAWAIARSGDKTQFAKAKKLCRTALAANSTHYSARGCLGVIYFKEGRLTEAEDQFRMSTRISPKGNFTELGALYVQMGKYDDAEDALKRAVKNNSNDVQARIEMGNLYLQTGRNNDAIKEFRQAVAIGPANEDTHKALALALLKVDRLDEAESVARTAIKNLDSEQRWPLHLALAKILTQRGDNTSERQYYEEAMSEVTQAIDRRADKPEVYLHSGIIRYKLGDLVRSWQDFRKCHKMAPDNYEAERNAKLVRRQLLKASPLMKTTTWGGAVLAVVCVVQLWWIWRGYFSPDKVISEKMLLILVPLLLGLFVVSFLLPVLVHLKLPGGFEAQLSQPKASDLISSGPKGDVTFSAGSSTVGGGALSGPN